MLMKFVSSSLSKPPLLQGPLLSALIHKSPSNFCPTDLRPLESLSAPLSHPPPLLSVSPLCTTSLSWGGGWLLPGAFPATFWPGHPYSLKGQSVWTWSFSPHPRVGRVGVVVREGNRPPPLRVPSPPILSPALAQSPNSSLAFPLPSSLPSRLVCSPLITSASLAQK